MRFGPVLRLVSVVAVVLAFGGGLSCSSGDGPETSTKTSDPTSGSTGSTGSSGSTDPSEAPGESSGQTTIVGTGCDLAPATTMPGDLSGGHIVCSGTADGEKLRIPPDTAVPSPDEGGGVLIGTLTEDGTDAALPGVVVVPELRLSVATGPDGRFGLAVEPGTYHLSAVVNRDVTFVCSTPTVEVTEGDVSEVAMSCHH